MGSLLAPYISDIKGRRMVIFIGGSLATLGAALQGGAVTIAMLIAGRFIAGLAIGLMSATIPVYCVRRLKSPQILPRPSLTDFPIERGCATPDSRYAGEHAAMDDWPGNYDGCKWLQSHYCDPCQTYLFIFSSNGSGMDVPAIPTTLLGGFLSHCKQRQLSF